MHELQEAWPAVLMAAAQRVCMAAEHGHCGRHTSTRGHQLSVPGFEPPQQDAGFRRIDWGIADDVFLELARLFVAAIVVLRFHHGATARRRWPPFSPRARGPIVRVGEFAQARLGTSCRAWLNNTSCTAIKAASPERTYTTVPYQYPRHVGFPRLDVPERPALLRRLHIGPADGSKAGRHKRLEKHRLASRRVGRACSERCVGRG